MVSSERARLDYFPSDYAKARERFRALAQARGAGSASYAIDASGPGGGTLSLDTAYVGAAQPRRLLIILSGTHGAEGFAGSALQSQWLDRLEPRRIPRDGGCLLIHAVNPYGFAWLRRANEHNVDLNRNALARFPGARNPAYAALDAWLNPASPPRGPDFFLARGGWLVLTRGWPTVKRAIVEGQYEFPHGLFYGGARTEASIAHVDAVLAAEAFRQVRRVFAIDIHTGLGSFATYKLMVDLDPGAEAYGELEQWFGRDALASSRPAGSVAYRVSGGLAELIERRFSRAGACACVLEFGTLSLVRLLIRLRRENRLYHYGRADGAELERARQALREAFCPNDGGWRARILAQGAEVFRRAARGLFDVELQSF